MQSEEFPLEHKGEDFHPRHCTHLILKGISVVNAWDLALCSFAGATTVIR